MTQAGYRFSFLPNLAATGLLGVWLAEHPAHDRLWWSGLLLAILVLLTPALVRGWERRVAQVVAVVEDEVVRPEERGAVTATLRRVDRAFWPLVAFALAFAAVFFTWYAGPGMARLGATGVRGRLAVGTVAGCFAYSVGVGLWITARTIALTASALAHCRGWVPFVRQQPARLDVLSRFAARTGATFSLGSLAVPAWLEAGRGTPLLARVMVGFGTVLFLGIGTTSFLVPQALIWRYAAAERSRRLDEVGSALARVADEVVAADHAPAKLGTAFRALADLRAEIARGHVLPEALTALPRVLATVVVPVISLAVQAFAPH